MTKREASKQGIQGRSHSTLYGRLPGAGDPPVNEGVNWEESWTHRETKSLGEEVPEEDSVPRNGGPCQEVRTGQAGETFGARVQTWEEHLTG